MTAEDYLESGLSASELKADASEAKDRRPSATGAAAAAFSLKRIDLISGAVQATLIFSLCASFSGTLFPTHSPRFQTFASSLMQSFLLSATVSGAVQTLYSEMELSLAAPDIVPTLLYAMVLARAGPDVSLGTAFAMISFMTVCAGWGCVAVGRIGFTSKANNRIPDHVFQGFVVVAGLLILSKGVKMSMPHDVYADSGVFSPSLSRFAMFALAGLPHGLGMFLQKRYQLVKSEFALPVILLAPLGVFFSTAVLAWGPFELLTKAREFGWLFESPPGEAASGKRFYDPMLSLYFSREVDVAVLVANLPLMLCVSAMLVGDVFFKCMGTIKMLNHPTAMVDQEMILGGKCNILCGLCGGVPSYVQMKLAALNKSVVGKNSLSRGPGAVSTLLLGLLSLSGLPLVLVVPRFFLAGILYNVAFGFILEPLLDVAMTSRQRLVVLFMVLLFLGKSFVLQGVLPEALLH